MSQVAVSAATPSRRRALSEFVELIGSMRFAISLLTLICIASVAGTVLPQNQPFNNYIDQFGPFWARLFGLLQLDNVYNAGWFLVIMAFLVISTSVCLWRNAPTLLRDAMSFREHARETSWRSFPHRTEAHTALAPEAAAGRATRWLERRGFRVRVRAQGEGMLVAAKAGTGNRLGYVCAHLAIVVICVGGLFDSELPIRLQVWLGGKQPVYENMRLVDVPASGRLSVDNPGYRATALIPEGVRTSNSVVMLGDGALVQPLPFQIRLDKFTVDYYETGMPSDFRSDVTVTDPATGESFAATIRVNEPLEYKGVTVYQSSFDDGGSSVVLTGYALDGRGAEPPPPPGRPKAEGAPSGGSTAASAASVGAHPAPPGRPKAEGAPSGGSAAASAASMGAHPFRLEGTVGDTVELSGVGAQGGAGALRLAALRPINVENVEEAGARQPMALGEHVAAVTGSAVRDMGRRFQNVGPSVEYQLIDAAGQVTDFHNYMLPVTLEGLRVFLLGTRSSAQEPFRYVRIPAGDDGTMTEFLQLRAALADPQARAEAARRFALRNLGSEQGEAARQMSDAVQDSASRALEVFAQGGLQALTGFLEANVPADELPRAAEVVVRLLGGAMAELRALAREAHGLAPVAADAPEAAGQEDAWLRQSLAALSDLALYPAPVAFMLTDFKHVQASVFQLNRSPGKLAVYTGCLLLVLGVFAMFYVRERRLWVWLRPEAGGSRALLAMTSQRRTLDFNQEFKRLEAEFARLYGKREET